MNDKTVITVDIGASKVRFFAVNNRREATEYLDTSAVNLIGRKMNNQIFLDILIDNIQKAKNASEKEGNTVVAISIGSPGPLDPFKGIIEDTPNLAGVKNLNIIEELKKIFNLPVFFLNDADAAGLGEYWAGSGKRFSIIFYITLSSGVGSASIVNGQLQRGLGNAPESGHTDLFVKSEQRQCSCGGWNHAEAFLGTNGLAETYAKVFNLKLEDLTSEDKHSVSPRMREGIADNNQKWIEVQEKYAEHLAAFLRNIIYNFQPEIIVIGGGIAFGNKPLLAKIQEKLQQIMDSQKDKMSTMAEGVQVALAETSSSVNFGAAKYTFDQLGIKTD